MEIKKLEVGQHVSLTKEITDAMNIPNDADYYIIGILDDCDRPICVKCDEIGENWMVFFAINEIISNK